MPNKTQLDRIEAAIMGNGREGLLTQVARVQETIKTIAELSESAMEEAERVSREAEAGFLKTYEAINTLTINVTKLTSSVEVHHKTDHLTDLMKKKSFWAVILVGYVVLHLVSTYVPTAWDAIMLFLGVPKLIIPIT